MNNEKLEQQKNFALIPKLFHSNKSFWYCVTRSNKSSPFPGEKPLMLFVAL